MADIPKYVLRLLKRRTLLAEELQEVSSKIDNYCAKIGLTDIDGACLCTSFLIYTEPMVAEDNTSRAIKRQLDENEKKRGVRSEKTGRAK